LGRTDLSASGASEHLFNLLQRADHRAPASGEYKSLGGCDLGAHGACGERVLTQLLWRDLAEDALRGQAPVEVDRRNVGGNHQHIGMQFTREQAAAHARHASDRLVPGL